MNPCGTELGADSRTVEADGLPQRGHLLMIRAGNEGNCA